MRHKPSFATRPSQVRFERRDLALYWGYVQGADPRTLHETYFPGEDLADLRHLKARVRVIAQDLAAAARRTSRPELGAVFLRDPGAISSMAGKAPTLNEFRQQQDPDGFYSEQELEELWAQQYGDDASRRPGQRRARLRVRIREAIGWIESQMLLEPEPSHRAEAWLPQVYARRLDAAGLRTLGELVAHINGRGQAWHRKIRGIGETKAREIEQWISRNERPGRLQLLPSSQLAPLQLARGELDVAPPAPVVPLERIQLPPHLDGSQGRFRGDKAACPLSADNDLDAIKAWLAAKASPHTQRSYTREAERLLLWCLLVLQKPVSSMTVEDCERYRTFLRDPQPPHQWCAPRGTPRWSRAWRPFEGPLTSESERHALIVLKSMVNWLRTQNYVTANPWAALGITAPSRTSLDKGRSFTPAQWDFVRRELDRLDDSGARPRLKFALWLFVGTGIRLSEASTRKVEDLVHTELSDGRSVWKLRVVGKRGKLRFVPLGTEVMSRLRQYLATRGIHDLAEASPETYLLARASGEGARLPHGLLYEETGGVAPGTMYRQLKAFFRLVARRCEDKAAAVRIEQASTHWLRHTFGTRLAALTKDVVLTRDLMGHDSTAITSIYLDSDEIEQQDAVEAMLAAAARDPAAQAPRRR